MSDYAERTWSWEVPEKASWPAVFSLTLGVFSLVTAEFLPASLLTPMAASLRISQGLAGQAVTATAMVALVAALLAAVVTRGLDRRIVLMGFSLLLIVSNLLVAAAPNLTLLLLARVLLGVALGGFWSMATAVAIRLVPAHLVPRALSILFSGVSLATIVAVPLGSYLGGLYGWRSVFLFAALIGLVTLLCQMTFLPRLPSDHVARLETLVEVLLRPGIRLGVICSVLVFGGHFALFTYVRPFLEAIAGVDANGIALMLLGFGVANFAGTILAGVLLERSLRLTLTLAPLVIGAAGLALAVWHVGLPGPRRAGGSLGHGLRRSAGRVVDLDGARRAGRDRKRRWHSGRSGADRHRRRRGLGRVDLQLRRRDRRLRGRRGRASADRGSRLRAGDADERRESCEPVTRQARCM